MSEGNPVPPPSDDRRKRPSDVEERSIKFVERKISEERLAALKSFLKIANADDIAAIRELYGDNLEVLKLIGLEVAEGQSDIPQVG